MNYGMSSLIEECQDDEFSSNCIKHLRVETNYNIKIVARQKQKITN